MNSSKLYRASVMLAIGLGVVVGTSRSLHAEPLDPKTQKVVTKGLDWIANSQTRLGNWNANDSRYPTAMTALAGMALQPKRFTAPTGATVKDQTGPALVVRLLRETTCQ